MTSFTTVQTAAMQRALRAAASPDAPPGPNPRVGCVILSADGDVLAEGHHRGAGTAHAEVDALANLAATGASARGASVLVTLEPCNHQGRTGPCVQALLDAGVAEVIYAQDDPTEQAGGGAAALEEMTLFQRHCALPLRRSSRLTDQLVLSPSQAAWRGRPVSTRKVCSSSHRRPSADWRMQRQTIKPHISNSASSGASHHSSRHLMCAMTMTIATMPASSAP